MAWPTPWFVGGANHDAAIARLLTYASFRGQYGVLSPLDCRALETEVPGPNIRVMPGAINIHAKGVGNEYQSYTNALPTQDVVSIPPTDASGPRSDLIIARVEDPNVVGAAWNHDPATTPVMYTRRIPDVPPDTNHVSQVRPDDSAETICRIDIPGGEGNETGTITNAMITDLRSIADLSGQRLIETGQISTGLFTATRTSTGTWSGSPGPNPLRSSDTGWTDWPPAASVTVPIPSWATDYDYEIKTVNIHKHSGPFWGEFRYIHVNSGGVSTPFPIDLNQTNAQGGTRDHIWIAGSGPVAPIDRGTLATFRTQAHSVDGAQTGILSADRGTVTIFTFNFKRLPAYN